MEHKCNECSSSFVYKDLTKFNGFCNNCKQRSKAIPFLRLYKKLLTENRWKNVISYEEFCQFTMYTSCFYCNSPITWIKYGKKATRYNLDRKDNSIGYIASNLVPCCSKCNYKKGDSLTFEEMCLINNKYPLFVPFNDTREGFLFQNNLSED